MTYDSSANAASCRSPIGRHRGSSNKDSASTGKWIVEIGELAGMRRSDVEHVKALLSRQFDEARPAYGRMRRRQPRTFICVGTTNEDTYLVDETGNRRFLPMRWLRSFGQFFRFDKWNVCQGQTAKRTGGKLCAP